MKILLVDDHALFAKSLEIALEDFTEVQQFSSTRNTSGLSTLIAKDQPDILLMDINLGKLSETDGLVLTEELLKEFPNQKIVILSGYNLPVYRKEAKRIGTKGFISKDIEPKDLVHVLIDIYNGFFYFSPEEVLLEDLTATEKQILFLMASGINRKQMANQLLISERTLSNHLQHIFEKLQVTSAIEAVTKAIQLGYISPIS